LWGPHHKDCNRAPGLLRSVLNCGIWTLSAIRWKTNKSDKDEMYEKLSWLKNNRSKNSARFFWGVGGRPGRVTIKGARNRNYEFKKKNSTYLLTFLPYRSVIQNALSAQIIYLHKIFSHFLDSAVRGSRSATLPPQTSPPPPGKRRPTVPKLVNVIHNKVYTFSLFTIRQ